MRKTSQIRAKGAPFQPTSRAALDQELLWYFGFAEIALLQGEVGLLPSYAAERVLAVHTTETARRRHGHDLARTVKECLAFLPARQASVLRATYTPRRWPKSVAKAFAKLSPIAVRLAFAGDPWPAAAARSGLESAAARRLSRALERPSRVPVARLRQRARRLLGGAIVAYARTRAEARALELG